MVDLRREFGLTPTNPSAGNLIYSPHGDGVANGVHDVLPIAG